MLAWTRLDLEEVALLLHPHLDLFSLSTLQDSSLKTSLRRKGVGLGNRILSTVLKKSGKAARKALGCSELLSLETGRGVDRTELSLRNPGQLKERCVPKNREALLPVPYSQGVCR